MNDIGAGPCFRSQLAVLRTAVATVDGWPEGERIGSLASLAEAEAGVGEFAKARAAAERAIDLSRQYHAGESEIQGLLRQDRRQVEIPQLAI